jgi:hypothetical protein
VVGFISQDPSEIGGRLVNPTVIGDQSQIFEMANRESVQRIIVALKRGEVGFLRPSS